jgi:hypothetical protein
LLAAARARRDGRHDHPGAEEGKLAAPVVLRFEIYAVAELSSRFSDLLFHALSRIAGAGSERFRG